MPKIKAVLFDLGNTLLYFNGSWPQVYAQADMEVFKYLKSNGYEIEEEAFLLEYRSRINEYFKLRELDYIESKLASILLGLLKDLGFTNTSKDIIEKALEKMFSVSQAHWLIEKDCLPMLDRLRTKGYRLGIVSNASDDSDVQKLVDKSQIREYFDFVLSSAAFGVRKPDPRIFSKALDFWGYKNEEVLMVGDTLNADILGAKNAKILNVWVKRRARKSDRLINETIIVPDHIIETLSELPKLLDKLSN